MKLIIITFVSIFFIYSCKNTNETSENIDVRAADSVGKAILKQFDEERKACNKLLSDTTYKKLFSAFCPADTMKMPMICSYKKLPFDTIIKTKKDTIIYSFKVSNICCSKYYTNYKMNADTLILSYNYCGEECDCDCDYTLTYKVPTKKYKYKHFVFRTDQEPKGYTQ